ncbi:hypothetical protein N7G274_009878 [Stereocaulon virgatum]|uniref:Homeobox domain-containing protein n=1 Tax=Stereocaulon virgatum TaxID=373712 RepID=A0ABR3ZVQ1_9LECA
MLNISPRPLRDATFLPQPLLEHSDLGLGKMESTENIPPSSASQDIKQTNSEGEEDQYAFLIHSQDTVSQNTPPNVDNQRLVRQKRRRTSPEDHAILEAEYEKNPKPDKAARIEIVNRVALGEKEVQIWFQNRRQLTRRKSRPLISTEIFSHFLSSQEHSDNPSFSSLSAPRSSQQLPSSQSSIFNSQSTVSSLPMILPNKPSVATIHSSVPQAKSARPLSIAAADDSGTNKPVSSALINTSALSESTAEKSQINPTTLIRSLSQSALTRKRTGYVADHCSAPFIIDDEQYDCSNPPQKGLGRNDFNENAFKSSRALKRTPSQVRLSLSLDGKAEVTTKTGTTPSPPRCQPLPLVNLAPRSQVGLQRSYSALEPAHNPVTDIFQTPYSRRSLAGRSRDARTWEFYCDSDARNALIEQAEREEKGSATAAISLIRSHSNKSKVITPNLNKRNAHTQKPDLTKRLKGDGQKTNKPKLVRATSSVARLQTSYGNVSKQKTAKIGAKDPKSSSQSVICQECEGDSDKENWEPGTQMNNTRRRGPMNAQRIARILEENLRVPSQSSSLDNLMNREKNPLRRSSMNSSSSKEGSGSEVDEEVAAFIGQNLPREEEDLDCVQNLLSLSQAAWQ